MRKRRPHDVLVGQMIIRYTRNDRLNYQYADWQDTTSVIHQLKYFDMISNLLMPWLRMLPNVERFRPEKVNPAITALPSSASLMAVMQHLYCVMQFIWYFGIIESLKDQLGAC